MQKKQEFPENRVTFEEEIESPTNHQPPTTNHQPPTTNHQPPRHIPPALSPLQNSEKTMNQRHLMPHLFTMGLLLLFAFPFSALGQRVLGVPDSLRLDSLESVPYTFLPIEACGSFLTPPTQPFVLFQDSATFAQLVESKRFIGQCKEMQIPQLDYSRNAMLGFDVFVDCTADIEVRLLRDTTLPGYRVTVRVGYGGCRAMRMRSYWLQIPALKEGEKVVIAEVDYEDYVPSGK